MSETDKTSRARRSRVRLLCWWLLGVALVLPFWNRHDPLMVGLILFFALGPFLAWGALSLFASGLDPKADQVLGTEVRKTGEHPANGIYTISSTPVIVRIPLAALLAFAVYQVGKFTIPSLYQPLTLLTILLGTCLDYRKAIVVPHKALVRQLSFAPPGWGTKSLKQWISVINPPSVLSWYKDRTTNRRAPPTIGYCLVSDAFRERLCYRGEETPLEELNEIALAYAGWGEGSIFQYQEMKSHPDYDGKIRF